MLVALSPLDTIGEFFGFFSLTEKISAGVGPALTAAMLFIFGGGAVGYRICIGSLATIIAAGHFLLLRVPDTSREGKVDEFAHLIRRPRERKMYAVKGSFLEQSWLAAVR